LLKDALGGGDASSDCGTAGVGSTVTSLVTSGVTSVAGGALRVGTKGDGRGDGQFVITSTAGTTPHTLLTATPGAASNTDEVNAALVVYPAETGHATRRFLVGNTATKAQWIAFGCQAESVNFSFPIGGLPTCQISYRVAYWVQHTQTVPVVATLEAGDCAVVAGGSVFFNTSGTAVRATRSPTSFEFAVEMGLAPLPALNASVTHRAIGGWERTVAKGACTMQLAFNDTDDAFFDADGSTSTAHHILATFSPTSRRAVGLYMPNAFIVGAKPTYTNRDGVLEYAVSFAANEGTTTTNELTRSAWRLLLG
jgi:hypothetical protein